MIVVGHARRLQSRAQAACTMAYSVQVHPEFFERSCNEQAWLTDDEAMYACTKGITVRSHARDFKTFVAPL